MRKEVISTGNQKTRIHQSSPLFEQDLRENQFVGAAQQVPDTINELPRSVSQGNDLGN